MPITGIDIRNLILVVRYSKPFPLTFDMFISENEIKYEVKYGRFTFYIIHQDNGKLGIAIRNNRTKADSVIFEYVNNLKPIEIALRIEYFKYIIEYAYYGYLIMEGYEDISDEEAKEIMMILEEEIDDD